MSKSAPTIDLERSELRYVFFARDIYALVEDFETLGFEQLTYDQTPVTRTLYFASNNGLEPGLSIKARLYVPRKTDNIWTISGDTVFNLLEIKATITEHDAYLLGMDEETAAGGLIDYLSIAKEQDIVYRIQKASEDSILHDSRLKTKNRVKGLDSAGVDVTTSEPYLQYSEVLTILSKSPGASGNRKLSPGLVEILNRRIRPVYQDDLVPFIMTQYQRIHLIPTDPDLKDMIRVTIDPGVEYYVLTLDDPENFLENPTTTAEFIHREKFYRLEFKIDAKNLKKKKKLEKEIAQIITKYRCMAYLSKKWIGATLVSERHIEKLNLWDETASMGKTVSGFFPVHPSWFNYRKLHKRVYHLIEQSRSFFPFEKEPKVLVKSENWVTGLLGVPNPSLIVTIEGPEIKYNLPGLTYPATLTRGQPEFFITEEDKLPLQFKEITSIRELDDILHPAIKIQGVSFFRSYGFLLISNNSSRVYKLTVERKTDRSDTEEPITETYCKMRYIGTRDGIPKTNLQEIYSELHQFFSEFAPIMARSFQAFEEEYTTDEP